jgi:hypothetical protein
MQRYDFDWITTNIEPDSEGDYVRYDDAIAAIAAEREACAEHLRAAAARIAPEGKRTNQYARHTAGVLLEKAHELLARANTPED